MHLKEDCLITKAEGKPYESPKLFHTDLQVIHRYFPELLLHFQTKFQKIIEMAL